MTFCHSYIARNEKSQQQSRMG